MSPAAVPQRGKVARGAQRGQVPAQVAWHRWCTCPPSSHATWSDLEEARDGRVASTGGLSACGAMHRTVPVEAASGISPAALGLGAMMSVAHGGGRVGRTMCRRRSAARRAFERYRHSSATAIAKCRYAHATSAARAPHPSCPPSPPVRPRRPSRMAGDPREDAHRQALERGARLGFGRRAPSLRAGGGGAARTRRRRRWRGGRVAARGAGPRAAGSSSCCAARASPRHPPRSSSLPSSPPRAPPTSSSAARLRCQRRSTCDGSWRARRG